MFLGKLGEKFLELKTLISIKNEVERKSTIVLLLQPSKCVYSYRYKPKHTHTTHQRIYI